MSQQKPTECYVYQPDPDVPGAPEARIYSVGGPGSEIYSGRGQRYTKAEAERIATAVNAKRRLFALPIGEFYGSECDPGIRLV